MRPSREARYAAAVTLAKGKMFEYGIPPEDHLELPENLDLEQQFPLAVGSIGDLAAETIDGALTNRVDSEATNDTDVQFAARVLQAFVDSRLNPDIEQLLRLLSSVGHYLAGRPGDSVVAAKRLSAEAFAANPLAIAVLWALDKPWKELVPAVDEVPFAKSLLVAVAQHFRDGSTSDLARHVRELRTWAYKVGSPLELLLGDLLGAACILRTDRSAWTRLPKYSNLSADVWAHYLERPTAIQEMWPSQQLLGEAGLYSGASAVVQMPTSAGKTRSTELIIRSAFLSQRATLALVVAPFRALCQETAVALRDEFVSDGYQVNQLSDALQPDYVDDLAALLGSSLVANPGVIVLTPEKLLYLLRQDVRLINQTGLVVYDEGHQFDTGSRGVTYELLLTSIKRELPTGAQSVLISAVIRNAPALANWLLNEPEKVVASDRLQTERLVAFASWRSAQSAGQLRFLQRGDSSQEFFVPSVIVQQPLLLRKTETSERVFPQLKSSSIGLYLALRVLEHGAAAIFCGTKLSAAALVRDAVEEVFDRGLVMPSPAAYSSSAEVYKMQVLYEANFGASSYLTRAAGLGIFAHHGNTPHGLRLAIEHGMRLGHLKLVVCTSTLAQGVNLPIRYLFVTGTMQGSGSIRARDFHNLMGRAGRAGMHGEGTVVFTDPKLFDQRGTAQGRRRWREVERLLAPDESDPTGSSLRDVLAALASDNRRQSLERIDRFEVVRGLVIDEAGLRDFVSKLSPALKAEGFSEEGLQRQIDQKIEVIAAVESFLMAYRADSTSDQFFETARDLARSTFAHSISTEREQAALEDLFDAIARRIETEVPDADVQLRYGSTLLGVRKAKRIDEWLRGVQFQLGTLETSDEALVLLWPLLVELSNEPLLTETVPADRISALARKWIAGDSFEKLLGVVGSARYPHGVQMRKFTPDIVVDLCEQAFGYQFGLLLAAIASAVKQMNFSAVHQATLAEIFDLLQKRLKYGLPSSGAISIFETGFSERVIAQELLAELSGHDTTFASRARLSLAREAARIIPILKKYPAYFMSVLESIVHASRSNPRASV